MTEINAHTEQTPVHGPEDVRHLYDGTAARSGDTPKIGIEIEQTLYNAAGLALPSSAQSEAMVARGAQDGMPVHHEPSASSLEIITDPFTPADLSAFLVHTEARMTYLRRLAEENGFMFSPFGHMPHITAEEHEVVQKERYQTFFGPPREDMSLLFRSFFDCMDIQTSASYQNAEQLVNLVRLSIALEPLCFLSTDSNSGFHEGSRIATSLRILLKDERGINGGIPDFYYTARAGDEFIDAHIDHTLSHPHMFTYFDFDGALQRLPAGRWVAFNDLERFNLGPRNLVNYRQSQSQSWRRAVNIAAIDDAQGRLVSHRAELASFQTGLMHQRVTAPLLTNLMAFDEVFYERTAALLRDYGIDLSDLSAARPVLEANFKNATYHGNRFKAVPFGTGTMGNFAAAMADIVEARYAGSGFEEYIAPILHIWRSGRPDWLVYRECFETLDEVKQYLHRFPEIVKDNPDVLSATSCADWALGPCLERKKAA